MRFGFAIVEREIFHKKEACVVIRIINHLKMSILLDFPQKENISFYSLFHFYFSTLTFALIIINEVS